MGFGIFNWLGIFFSFAIVLFGAFLLIETEKFKFLGTCIIVFFGFLLIFFIELLDSNKKKRENNGINGQI